MIHGWISIAWPMMAGVAVCCGSLSLMAAWLIPRQRAALLAFGAFNMSVAFVVGFEFAMLRATTPEAYGLAMRWGHLPVSTAILASIVFLRLQFGAGRIWLFYTAIGVRLLTPVANFLSELNISFLSITELRTQAIFGGETVSVPIGVGNPWSALVILSTLLYLWFVLDATLACWRRGGEGDRRRAVLIGGSFLFFILASLIHGQLVLYGGLGSIYTIGVPFLAVAMAVTAELGVGLLRARQLGEALALSHAEGRRQARQLADVAEAAKLGTWELDTGRGQVVVSDQTRALLGITAPGPIDLEEFLSGLAAEDREAVRAAIDRVLREGGDYEVEFRWTLPDGRTRWVHSRGQAEVDAGGRWTSFRGISFDVTELREAQEQSRLVVEAAAFAIVGVGRDGRIVLVNRQAERLFGYPRAELVGGSIDKLLPMRFGDRHRDHVATTFENPSMVAKVDREVFGRCSDGSEKPLQIGLSMIHRDGQPLVLASIVDLTERKRAEHELEQQRLELSHLSRITMLGELSGSLAHELNQPLAAILSNAQAALRFLEVGQPDLDEVREILRDIVDDDKRAGEIIRGLRLLLKRGEMRHEPVEVNDVVLDVLRLLNSNTVNANVRVSTDLARDLPPVTGDRVQLQQVVLNLVMNACDAMAATSVPERTLRVSTTRVEGDAVQIDVTDQGTGIAPDLLEGIFEPFVTTRSHGLGLGLSVCRQIVLAHHGRIRAFNNPGRGATVQFILPLRAEGSA